MHVPNRRKAGRVEVGIPVQLRTPAGDLEAQIVDLSRTGLRIRLPADPATETALAAAERLREVLAPSFTVDLHYKRLGPLLNKCVFPIRVGIPADAAATVEVRCEFEEALQDMEIGYLELTADLPEMDESVPEWVDVEAPAPAAPCLALPEEERRQADRPPQRYRALIAGMKHDAPPSLFCHTDLVTRTGVRVRLPRDEAGIPSGDSVSVSWTLRNLISRYGADLELRIVSAEGDVWSGPSRFCGVELPRHHPAEVLVTLAFERALTLNELRALCLVGGAA